jgi:hypothetical protein
MPGTENADGTHHPCGERHRRECCETGDDEWSGR